MGDAGGERRGGGYFCLILRHWNHERGLSVVHSVHSTKNGWEGHHRGGCTGGPRVGRGKVERLGRHLGGQM